MHNKFKSAALALACALAASVAFANTTTTNYSLNKPSVGADADNWGALTNSNWDALDSIVFGLQGTANAACPKAGCTFTGGITGTTASFSSTLSVTGLLTASGGVSGNLTGNASGNAGTASRWQTARTETLSGDVTGSASVDGSGNWTITTTLANTGGGANVGDSTHVPVLSIDTKGRVLTATSALISAGGLGFASGGTALAGSVTIPTSSGNVIINWGVETNIAAGGNSAVETFTTQYSVGNIGFCGGSGGGPGSAVFVSTTQIQCRNNGASTQNLSWISIGK